MEEKKKRNARKFLTEKGFYIVLLICVAVIGVCAWFLWSGGKNTENTGDLVEYEDTILTTFPEYGDTIDGIESSATVPEEEAEVLLPEEEPTVSVGEWEELPGDADEVQAEPLPEETLLLPEEEEQAGVSLQKLPCVWPVSGEIAHPYAVETLLYSKTMDDWRIHDGIDIAADLGTRVRAMTTGTVLDVYENEMMGTTVTIDHGGGLVSTYSNLAGVPAVETGDFVEMGDVIGSVGNTALGETGEVSHLHFAVSLDGESVDPGDYLE